jgi:tRNA(adenine34) deaminase
VRWSSVPPLSAFLHITDSTSMTTLSTNDTQHLRSAIELAARAEAHGNRPYGAVIVATDGTVLATAENTTIRDNDSAAHAELNAIRRACSEGQQDRLAGATIYASTEPCPMCAGAIVRFGFRRIVYGEDAELTAMAHGQSVMLVHVPSRAIFAHAPHDIAVIGPCKLSG